MRDSLPEKLLNEPMTYINGGGIAMSLMDIESAITIVFYAVSIIASLFLIRKYYWETRKLKESQEEEQTSHKLFDDEL
jgi:hypothetical protein